jgi:hypothetical protein
VSDRAFSDRRARRTVSLRAKVWFAWMVVMWAAFFALLAAGQLDGLWSAIRDLPLVAQILLWIPFFPWMLGMAVWASSWVAWLRVTLVVCFAVGWTLASLPRAKRRT